MNLKNSIRIQRTLIRNLVLSIEELEEAMRRYTLKSQVVFSALWDKSWDLRGELEKERSRLQHLADDANRPNRDKRRSALIAGMYGPERLIEEGSGMHEKEIRFASGG